MSTTTAAAAASQSSLLSGQRILVTGGGRGISRAMAHICHVEGARVAICARSRSELEETAATANSAATAAADLHPMLVLSFDVTKEDQVEGMVRSIVEQWGGLDVVINNAGTGQVSKGAAETLSSEDFRRLLELNVIAVHTVTSTILRHCPDSLRCIVNVSSRAGKIGIAEHSFYCASKFALEGYSATLAEELRDRNCVVNTISPGMVDTRSFPKPKGRPGARTPESIRDGLLLLLLTANPPVTGHYLHVDELDEARAKGLPDSAALKPIREPTFSP